MVSKPLLRYIADYTNKLKAIIGVLAIIQVTFVFMFLAFPVIRKSGDPNKINSNTFLKFLLDNLNSTNLTELCQQGAMPFSNMCSFLTDGKKSFNNKCSEYIPDETFTEKVH
ncbi:major facilitator superfamily domain-containing protein 6 [Trichonephila clavata]|uniref:Major facilitator superfamily domain-containing protein 6 n=1 Tax=Trichonephila clavata TaxID=2740835 RepID=A0A8X6GYY0_TRICU|nr:major facilitator superfamily domain-containing protein 6 [Trichonephila clavata]